MVSKIVELTDLKARLIKAEKWANSFRNRILLPRFICTASAWLLKGSYTMPVPGYNVRKAAQVTAFFAQKGGGSISVLKLAKLLYLADREFMSRYDMPILFDHLVSMPHGPVTSVTLNYINGLSDECRGQWEEFVVARANNSVGAAQVNLSIEELDELSEAETHVLEATWDQFGHMDHWQIRNYTHDHCPEWEDPHGSSNPIPYERVFKFLQKENSADIADEIESLRSLDKYLAHAR